MRSPSGVHQSGMRGRDPVATAGSRRPRAPRRRRRCRPRPRAGPSTGPCPGSSARPGSSSSWTIELLEAGLDALDRARRARRGRRSASDCSRPMPSIRRMKRHGAAGGDHRLRRDAVPQVGGAADDVALDQRDLGAETGGIRGRLVAGRSAADDHEAHGHCPRVPARSRGLASTGRGLGEGGSRGG